MHGFDDLRFCPINLFLAMLLVLRNARVVPVSFSGGPTMFFTPCGYGADRLSNILSLRGALTFELVYAWFEGGVMLRPTLFGFFFFFFLSSS